MRVLLNNPQFRLRPAVPFAGEDEGEFRSAALHNRDGESRQLGSALRGVVAIGVVLPTSTDDLVLRLGSGADRHCVPGNSGPMPLPSMMASAVAATVPRGETRTIGKQPPATWTISAGSEPVAVHGCNGADDSVAKPEAPSWPPTWSSVHLEPSKNGIPLPGGVAIGVIHTSWI